MRLVVIYDVQATNKKQGGLPVRDPPPSPASLLLVAKESYMTPSRQKYILKYHLKKVEAYLFGKKKRLKQHFLYIKTFNKIYCQHIL
jgi:hypothetical protein